MKEERKLRIYEMSGYRYRPTPAIMLKGEWLKELGFSAGRRINVRCEGGKLTITLEDEILTE